MKQIILITDGCSNVGISPVVAAAHALTEGIVVNVVGVIDQGEIGEMGASEIADIAQAGGGLSRIVESASLSQTVQMMTRQTVAHTIKEAVSSELRTILGSEDITRLHPDKRAQIVRTIDELSESTDLRVALLVDASASMKPKLRAVKDTVRDLMLSLEARAGTSELCVFHFPGARSSEEIQMDAGWSRQLAKVPELFYNINMKGTTPTGPALLQTIRYFADSRELTGRIDDRLPEVSGGAKDGMLGDYIV